MILRRRSCSHWRCRLEAWYARRNHIKGMGPHSRYRTAYIYPDSCYRKGRA